jgi:predicted ATP-grasp superfamily ATP-dependent carboligase
MSRVLVTDGDQRSALAVVRSLGRAGHTVIVAAPREASLAGASRFAAVRAAVPDPLTASDAFADAVADLSRRHGCDFAVPVTDASSLALLAHADRLAPARMPGPTIEEFRRISDKAEVAAAAAAVGIDTPRQARAAVREEVAALAASAALVPPLVLKPARSVAGDAGGRARHGVVHAPDWPAAVRRAASLPEGAYPLLVQERIVGPGTGVFLLIWDGRVLASFAHRRLREKPPSGGVSVLCESVPLDRGLLDRSVALLSRFGWSGVAMVEYKMDAATGRAAVMEVNGRFWGSLQLAIDAGVDFPRLLLECAQGRVPEPVTSHRVGVLGRWFWGDVDHLWARLRRSATALSLPPDAPGRLGAVAAFLGTAVRGARGQVYQAGDGGPARRELRDRLREVLGR